MSVLYIYTSHFNVPYIIQVFLDTFNIYRYKRSPNIEHSLYQFQHIEIFQTVAS